MATINTMLNNDSIQNLTEALSRIPGMGEVIAGEHMSIHTTFKVGGSAALFLTVNTTEALEGTLKILEHTPVFVIGKGSNLLVSDSGFEGCILKLGSDFKNISLEEDKGRIYAGGAVSLAALAAFALNHNLTGLEFAGGIPGTLGGGLVMNAGAYGGELSDVVEYADVMDRKGKRTRLTAGELELGYRSSVFKKGSRDCIILGASLILKKGETGEISARMEEYSEARKSKQPLDYPSAGSTFKRPEGFFAGKLISDAGLKGFSVGGARVSEKHAGFIINAGGATAVDVYSLICRVQETVYEKYGVMLEPEVIMLGEFGDKA